MSRGRTEPLHVRWLGGVPYHEADALQRALHDHSTQDYLLLLEHPHTYTLGTRADPAHVLVDPATVGATLVQTDRGGDVTYHGPGQLVGYPVGALAVTPAGGRDVVAHVRRIEAALIAALAEFGITGARVDGRSGVWVGNEKIAAIGVRVARDRTMHGFALNVDPDLGMFDHHASCGISDAGVTSMAAVLGAAPPGARRGPRWPAGRRRPTPCATRWCARGRARAGRSRWNDTTSRPRNSA